MTEKERFFKRLENPKYDGLRGWNCFFSRKSKATSEEEIYAELNRMEEAMDQVDPEVLLDYTMKVCRGSNS